MHLRTFTKKVTIFWLWTDKLLQKIMGLNPGCVLLGDITSIYLFSYTFLCPFWPAIIPNILLPFQQNSGNICSTFFYLSIDDTLVRRQAWGRPVNKEVFKKVKRKQKSRDLIMTRNHLSFIYLEVGGPINMISFAICRLQIAIRLPKM